MNAMDNRQLMQDIFSELSNGNGRPFVEAMADDFCWIITGTTQWSRTYSGKRAVRTELLDPLFARFATQYRNSAKRIIAEGDMVVVECRGQVVTKAGDAYNNTYCYVIHVAGGKMKELTEYWDTALAEAVLGDPVARQVA